MAARKTRKIGNDEVSAVGYGAMGIASHYGSVPSDKERLKVRCASYVCFNTKLTRTSSFWTNCTLVAVPTGTLRTSTGTRRF